MMYFNKMGATLRFDIGKDYPDYRDFYVECTYKPAWNPRNNYNRYNKGENQENDIQNDGNDINKDKYYLTMRLGIKTIDELIKVDMTNIDTQRISGTRETVKYNIAKIVEQACKSGFFDEYVKHYKYVMKCFEIGNDVLEEERSKKIKEEMNKEGNSVNDSNNDMSAA